MAVCLAKQLDDAATTVLNLHSILQLVQPAYSSPRSTTHYPKATDKMPTEKELQIAPIVQESVMHNSKVGSLLWLTNGPGIRHLSHPLALHPLIDTSHAHLG